MSRFPSPFVLAVLAFLLPLVGGPVLATETQFPRQLEYRIAWNGLGAATAVVSRSDATIDGDAVHIVEANVWTNRVVDIFWKFRGKAKSVFLRRDLYPRWFQFDRTSNRRVESTWVKYDTSPPRAHGVYIKKGKRTERDVDDIAVVDPISAAFRALGRPISVGDRISAQLFTGESRYQVDLAVLAEETIDIPAGRYRAYRIDPTVWKITSSQQKDKRLRHATLWVSKQAPRSVLRIRSEVFVGAVTLDLVR